MTIYAAWMHNVGARGAFASHNKRIITADDPEKIWQAFGGAAEAVELTTVDIDAWLAEQGRPAALLLDNPPKSAVPTPEELKASSRWRPVDPDGQPTTDERDTQAAARERAAWTKDVARMLRERTGAPSECLAGLRYAADFLDPA